MTSITQNTQIMPILSCLSADAASVRTSEVIDTKGYSRVSIVYHCGPQHNSSVLTVKLQHGDVAFNETIITDGADVEGSLFTVAGTDDGNVKVWEFTPSKRYCKVVVTKDTSNATNESIIAFLSHCDKKPPAHAAGGTGAGTGTGTVATLNLGYAASGTA